MILELIYYDCVTCMDINFSCLSQKYRALAERLFTWSWGYNMNWGGENADFVAICCDRIHKG